MTRKIMLLLLAGSLVVGFTITASAETMQVQVKEGVVRSQASFLGPKVASLPYGTEVETMYNKDSWYQVSSDAGSGWMHGSALTSKTIIFNADSADVSSKASSNEIALAGKGFNKQVEDEYRSRNSRANYGAVDRMESITIQPDQVAEFVQQGQLEGKEAGK